MFHRSIIMTTKLFLLFCVVAVAKCEVLNQKFIFDTIFSMETICSKIFEEHVISATCHEQLIEACRNKTVLLTMLDASSKFPYTGIMEGSELDLGGFDQCIKINHGYENGRVLGKHCLGGFLLPVPPNNPEKIFKLSTCIPNQCTAEDYNRMFGDLLNLSKFLLFNDYQCTTNEAVQFEVADIVTISIIIVCVFLMTISTIYNVYLQKRQQKPPHPLCLAFSVLYHGPKLLQTSKGTKEQIQVFHGIKVISMMWIIAGHGFASWNNYSVINVKDLEHLQHSMEITYIDTAHVAVDTFFYISGFLMSYLYLKSKSKPLMVQFKSVPYLYIHRYLRLTPAVLMLYLTFLYLIPHIGTGPIYQEGVKRIREPCEKNWWAFFFYFQNYHNYDDLCLVHTWYLSADMQMFLVAPLVLIPLAVMLNKGMFKLSMAMMSVLNILLIAVPLAIDLSFTDYRNGSATHPRLITYFVGIMMGVFMREKKDKAFLYDKFTKKIMSLINLIIWIVVLTGMLIMLIYYEDQTLYHGYESQVVYNYLMRPAWCFGLSWIVYSCYHGYGGFVNWFLSRPIFQIGGRLSYCMYLLHGLVISHYVMTTRTRIYFSHYIEFYLWCGYFILTAISSFFWTLAFESPMITIEKFIFGGATSKEKSKADKQEQNP